MFAGSFLMFACSYMYWLRASVPARVSPVIQWINLVYLRQAVREEDRASRAGRMEVES